MLSSDPAPIDLSAPAETAYRVTLPTPLEGVEACLRKAFPEIPDKDLTTREMIRILGKAIVQDKAKTACGLRAVAWIERVRRDLAR